VQRIQRIELVTDAPAIIVRRAIGEAINRGDLKFGQKPPAADIVLVKLWEPMNRDGDKLGRNIALFAAPENLPGNPQTFSGNAKAVGPLDNWHGFSGWACDRNDAGTSSYEEGLFRGYKDGSAFKKWGAPEPPLVNGKDRDLRNVSDPAQNMLALNRDKTSRLYDTFVSVRAAKRTT
jgi:hypothetical protein